MLYTDDTGECKVGKIKGGSSAGPPGETIRVYTSTTPTSTTTDCYTEENINYDVTLVGLQRLNHGIRFETPNPEKCRVYCSDNYPEAEFFTWRTDNKKCFCKQSKGVLKEISEVISGNVKCI